MEGALVFLAPFRHIWRFHSLPTPNWSSSSLRVESGDTLLSCPLLYRSLCSDLSVVQLDSIPQSFCLEKERTRSTNDFFAMHSTPDVLTAQLPVMHFSRSVALPSRGFFFALRRPVFSHAAECFQVTKCIVGLACLPPQMHKCDEVNL